MPEKQRGSTTNVLPEPGFWLRTPYVQLERYHASELSLSGSPECLSLHAQYSAKVQKMQESPCCARLSFLPAHECGGI